MTVAVRMLITVIIVAVLMALIALPLALRKVPRNRIYGVRTRRTLADDTVWYEANAYGGRALLVASGVTIAVALVLYMFGPLPDHLVLPVSLALLAAPSLAAALLAVRHAGRRPK